MPNSLIIEDEISIQEAIAYNLTKQGFTVEIEGDGRAALEKARATQPDLLILDIMLPGLDGIEVCKQLRAVSTVPIIMVTARIDEIDRLLGLELGADDYICKPFSPREVVARVKAVLRRTERGKLEPLNDGLVLDRDRFSASLNGAPLDLTAVEFALLEALSKKPGHVLSRTQLLDRMYTDYRVVGDRAVDTHIKNLRKKLNAAAPDAQAIEAVYGLGYRYNP